MKMYLLVWGVWVFFFLSFFSIFMGVVGFSFCRRNLETERYSKSQLELIRTYRTYVFKSINLSLTSTPSSSPYLTQRHKNKYYQSYTDLTCN